MVVLVWILDVVIVRVDRRYQGGWTESRRREETGRGRGNRSSLEEDQRLIRGKKGEGGNGFINVVRFSFDEQ